MRRRPWISQFAATGRSWGEGYAIPHLLCGLLLFASSAIGWAAGHGGFGGFRPAGSTAGGYTSSGSFPGVSGGSYGSGFPQSYSGVNPVPQYGAPSASNQFPAPGYGLTPPGYSNGSSVSGYGNPGSGSSYGQGYGAPVQGYDASPLEYTPSTPGFWVPVPDYGRQDRDDRDAVPRFGPAPQGYDRPAQGYRFREQPGTTAADPSFPRFRPSPMGMDSPYRWGRDEGALGPPPVYRPLEGAQPGSAVGGQGYSTSPSSYAAPVYRPGSRRSDPRFRPLTQ